eukprot:GGOE01060969.1.p1 GENE.GGOE01060969.1~~GGOE01060969.1.p1  ORF type:complete len:186 (+),score=21.35 GGOE01060969.1:96-653(+)
MSMACSPEGSLSEKEQQQVVDIILRPWRQHNATLDAIFRETGGVSAMRVWTKVNHSCKEHSEMARRVCQDLHEATSQQLMMSCIAEPPAADHGDGVASAPLQRSTRREEAGEGQRIPTQCFTAEQPSEGSEVSHNDLINLKERMYILLQRKDELKSAFAQNQEVIMEKKQRLKKLQGSSETLSIS